MKNRFSKIMGAVVTLVTIVSMFVVASPVAADDQTWSSQSLPSTTGLVMFDGSSTNGIVMSDGPITTAIDGTLYAYARFSVPTSPDTGLWLIKSTNFGRTWSKVGANVLGMTKLVCSPTDAKVIYYSYLTTLYKSIDSGVTFVAIANTPVGAGNITALDVQFFAGSYVDVVGTVDGNVYFLTESDVFFNFVALGTNSFVAAYGSGAVLSVNFSPAFATDRAVYVVARIGANIVIGVDVAGGSWGAAVAPAIFAGTADKATIHFPTDFALATSNRFFFALNGSTGGAYWYLGGAVTTNIARLNGLTATNVASLDQVGALLSSSLMVGLEDGTVRTSIDGGVTWTAPTAGEAPTGPATDALVVMKSDFATTGVAIVLVKSSNAANDESGVSMTSDKGVTWNQISLLNSSFTSINDLAANATYTWLPTSRSATTGAVAGGSFTVTNGGVIGSGFTVTAPSGSGDQFRVTVAAGAPTQQIALNLISGSIGVTTTGTATAIGNTLYLAASATATYTALADGSSASLTVNGSSLPLTPFFYLTFSKPTDADGDILSATSVGSFGDTGIVNISLPDDTNAQFTYTSTGTGTVVGSTNTVLTGTWATGSVTFTNVGDTATFTATTAGSVVTPAAVGTNPTGSAVTFGVTSGTFPAAVTLTNAATNSVVTLSGTGAANVTVTGTGFSVTGLVITFTTVSAIATVTNNTFSTQAVTVTTTSGPAAVCSLGPLPLSTVLSAAAASATAFTNMLWRLDVTNKWYERVRYTAGDAAAFNILKLAATGNVLYMSYVGGTTINKSVDNGGTWAAVLMFPALTGTVQSLLAIDANTVIIGGSNSTTSKVSGAFLTVAPLTSDASFGNVTSFAVSSDGTAILAGGSTSGKVARSTDAGATWSVVTGSGLSGNVYVAFEQGSNSVYYATGSSSGMVMRRAIVAPATTASWVRADNVAGNLDSLTGADVTTGNAIVSGVAGGTGNTVVYALDNSGNHVSRVTNNAVNSTTGTHTAGNIAAPSSTVSSGGLWISSAASGANVLWAIFPSSTVPRLYTYTDKLAVPVANVTATAITASSATIAWDAAALGAFTSTTQPTYQVAYTLGSVAQRSPYTAGSTTGVTVVTMADPMKLTVGLTGLSSVSVYTVSVWATTPVVSFVGSKTFTTIPTIPLKITPGNGDQYNQSLLNFSWTSVSGATGYELWLDTKVDFSTAVKNNITTVGSNGDVVSDWAPAAALTYSTVYYWQVRAITAAGNSAWSTVWSFTTEKAPTTAVVVTQNPVPTIVLTATSNPVPTIIISQQPAVTVTQAAPAVITVTQPSYTLVTPTAETPSYIWIIVGVGALLTLAVIILIIRTRRVV